MDSVWAANSGVFDATTATLIVCSVTSVLILLVLWLRRYDKGRLGVPSGSMGWPFIGETLDFVSCALSSSPESFMDKRTLKYGKVFKSHLLGTPTIVSTDPEVNKLVLHDGGRTFVPCYPKSLNELMGRSSILMINGNMQKKLHRLIGSFLKSPDFKQTVTSHIVKYVLEAMACWKDGDLVYLQDQAKNVAFRVLLRVLTSLEPGPDMEYLRSQYRQFSAGFVSLPLKLPGSKLYRSLQAKANMLKIVNKMIEDRTESMSEMGKPRDVLEVLLGEKEFSMDLVRDNIIDLMIPGEDTGPLLITLAVKYLSDCPAALEQMREENMAMKKSKQDITWIDYMSLAFTQHVISETLRMGNIITGVMRKALYDVEIRGHLIPKGWCVYTYFRSVHLDAEQYQDPYKFNPWRWQGREITGSNFTPFGSGQRLCPGLEMARLQTSIFLHHLVTRYRWDAEEDTAVSFPTVRMKRRLPIRVTRMEED